jgi:hypothetical protein
MRRLALNRGGICLSTEYKNVKTPLRWRCSCGNEWDAPAEYVLSGSWCHGCGRKRAAQKRLALTINDLKSEAKRRGGDCLSERYMGGKVHHEWVCDKGHKWFATPSSVLRLNTWCPECRGTKKHSLSFFQELANRRGGRCLSTEYKHANAHMEWMCKQGHTWTATASQIKNGGTWCPQCANEEAAERTRKYSISDMQLLAESRFGQCLSRVFLSVDRKLRWRCAEGHEWEAIPASIIRGGWCPTCSSYVTERICRKYFELLFACPFPKTRPKWLRIGKQRALELDGYAAGIHLAFEYQGRQHYQSVTHYDHDLAKRFRYDEIKRSRCRERCIVLIEVPHPVKPQEMERFIRSECRKRGITVPRKKPIGPEELAEAYLTSTTEIDVLRVLAAGKGGALLSTRYVNAVTPMEWRCEHGHTWRATPNSVKNNGTWCPTCADNCPDTLETMQQLASCHGGACLSTAYVNQATKLKWRCREGHEWEAIPRNVKNLGYWCPYCSGLKLWAPGKNQSSARLAELAQIASQRGGKCLSATYHNSSEKLLWHCEHGHEWSASANNIKRGKWCPFCCGLRIWAPETNESDARLEQLRAAAKDRGGLCLAESYEGQGKKVLWQCAQGHRWSAKPSHILHSRSWCPECAKIIQGYRRPKNRSRLRGNPRVT